MELWREELYHHGIKGQKWGIRRFQKKDGSLTRRGKQRYEHEGYINAHKKRSIREMSNEELREANTRLQLEQQYHQLKEQNSKYNRGLEYVKTTADAMGSVLNVYNNGQKLVSTGQGIFNKMFNRPLDILDLGVSYLD